MNEFLRDASKPNMRLKLVSLRVELPKPGFIVARRVYNINYANVLRSTRNYTARWAAAVHYWPARYTGWLRRGKYVVYPTTTSSTNIQDPAHSGDFSGKSDS